jgi:hypothetical protein
MSMARLAAGYLAAELIERQYHGRLGFDLDRIAQQTGLDLPTVARLRDGFLARKPAHAALIARLRTDLNQHTTKGTA